MRELAHTLFRNRLVALFALMVLLPAFAVSVLIVRAIRSEQRALAYEAIERQREVVRLTEADLNTWLFSSGPDSARSHAVVRFDITGNHIVFPDFQLSLPADGAPRLRPFEAAPAKATLTRDSVAVHYYPRIQVFLRDVRAGRHAGAQYFLRLRSLVVQPPGTASGYVVDVQPVLAHINRKLAELCAAHSFTAVVWIADAEKRTAPSMETYGLQNFPFFEVAFTDTGGPGIFEVRRHAFAYSMTLLVAVTILGSLFVHRALSQEVRLSHLRSEFVAAVSHEFRSPLSSIMALAERAVSGRSIAPDQLAEYHRIIERDARRLSVLVTRLLEFGRIEDGKAQYSLERVDLVAVTEEAIQSVRHVASGSRLRFSRGSAPLWVRADRTALSHAIENLIENAAKYSAAEMPIDVTCTSANGSNIVEVRDRGIGIPAAEQQKIFEKFYRGRGVVDLTVQGVGIGLSLVKHVVDAHGGSVSVDSAIGEGSRFSLRLPRIDA